MNELGNDLPEWLPSLWLGVIGLSCLFTVTGFWGRYYWLFDLTSHFRLQYLAVQVLGFVLLRDNLPLELLLVAFSLVNASKMVRYRANALPKADIAGLQRLRVLHINVQFRSWNYDGVLRYIERVNPDLLSLQEVDAKWRAALLPRLRELFPYSVMNPEAETGFLSKIPFESSELRHTTDPHVLNGVIIARMQWQGLPFTVYVTHAHTPEQPAWFRYQRRHLTEVGEMIRRDEAENLLLMGDFNTTPFSDNFKSLLATSGLNDGRIGFGLKPTWPIYLPIALIPIDHCLLRGRLQLVRYDLGPFVGSDHLPVYWEFALPSSQQAAP